MSGSEGTSASDLTEALGRQGVCVVAGWATNAAGLVHAKSMPVARTDAFVTAGAGMSPVHHGYALDGTIQLTPFYDAVGDLRMRLVPEAVRVLPGGLAVGPTHVVTQDGEPDPTGPRHVLTRAVERLAEAGLTALVGHELEFVLVAPDGSPLPPGAWTPYGLSAIVDRSAIIGELLEAADVAGLGVEQVHAEYGAHQLELSLAPRSPVEAADSVILLKSLIGVVTRAHGLAASFSPVPIAGAVGNGAHQHLSLRSGDANLFDAPQTPPLTPAGGHAVAGILDGLLGAQAVLTGSILSGPRLRPGMWSGATVCWGTENREAALRYLRAGPANPHGANVEVKVIDPSANPYLATAALLGLALDGIERELPLPPEIVRDTGQLDDAARAEAGLTLVLDDQDAVLDAFAGSAAERVLGEHAAAALLAVRRHERTAFGDLDLEQLCERLRLRWSI
ncbi:glutamine synthetase family protein [Humibacillus xanthopallidus]|uniref:Glutamine synthetase n=1 Tax=Humibacillus xanthopallidus TaxID=412689 RepID=A0A543H9W7_9MICO|nr:glutamine synthetase family protein [Humibacillus xanthopallidus]TQM55093.1 glutamine synthetase [Humibacillus xanthopallidus]